VYVTDDENASFDKQFRVQKFAPDGTFITMWGDYGFSEGEFNYPYDVAMYCNEWAFVVDGLQLQAPEVFLSADGIESVPGCITLYDPKKRSSIGTRPFLDRYLSFHAAPT
jgi:hypothetical protein